MYFATKFAQQYHFKIFGTYQLDNLNWLIWYGPLSAVLYAVEILIFGFKEFGLRIIQPVFMVLSSICIYKLVSLYRSKKTALLSSILFLFLPAIFYYSSISYLESGLLFFTTSSLYYFMSYNKTKNTNHLLISSLLIGLGFLYKNPIIFLYPIFFIYTLIFSKIKLIHAKALAYSLILIIPHFILNALFDKTHGGSLLSSFQNWKFINLVISNFLLVKQQATIIIFILFTIALIYSVYKFIKTKDGLIGINLLWFLLIYIPLVSYFGLDRSDPRITLQYLPVIAILTVELLSQINLKKIIYVLIIYLIIGNAYLMYNDYGDRYLPYDSAFKYIKTLDNNENIYAPMIGHPYNFYTKKYDIKNKIIEEVYYPYPNQTILSLHEYMVKNNITYFMFPLPKSAYIMYTPQNLTWIEYAPNCEARENTYLNGRKLPGCPLNKELLKDIYNNNDYFTKEAEFALGGNKIILVKLKQL